jgi:Family of unknown function (DUF6152)
VLLLLVSDAGRFMTGSTVVADGDGRLARLILFRSQPDACNPLLRLRRESILPRNRKCLGRQNVRATQIAEGEERMKTQLTAVLAGGALVMMGGAALAHHSFAMFNMANPIEIQGTVKEFRFVSPHTILIVTVKGSDGVEKDWILEGGAPGLLVRDGMRASSLKPGDEIRVTINPLHSGAEGGSFQPLQVKYKDGTPVVKPR